MTATITTDFYPAALRVDEIFADDTYQRVCDVARARKMAATWDRRLAGILEVSDRGEHLTPRYAIIDGQHRWAAAGYLVDPPPMVANIHTGLTVADEAKLFDQLNRQRRQPSTWDHWKARRAAGDEDVAAIETVVDDRGLVIDMSPADGRIACVSALEKVVKLGGIPLLDNSLQLITKVWGSRRDGLDASIIRGTSLVLFYLNKEIDPGRLVETLEGVFPRQLKAHANTIREIQPTTEPVATAIAVMSFYNKQPGRKLLVSNRTFGGSGVVNNGHAKADA